MKKSYATHATENYLEVDINLSKSLRFFSELKPRKDFLETNKDFEIDRKWCDLFGYNATFNPNGYLKKI